MLLEGSISACRKLHTVCHQFSSGTFLGTPKEFGLHTGCPVVPPKSGVSGTVEIPPFQMLPNTPPVRPVPPTNGLGTLSWCKTRYFRAQISPKSWLRPERSTTSQGHTGVYRTKQKTFCVRGEFLPGISFLGGVATTSWRKEKGGSIGRVTCEIPKRRYHLTQRVLLDPSVFRGADSRQP